MRNDADSGDDELAPIARRTNVRTNVRRTFVRDAKDDVWGEMREVYKLTFRHPFIRDTVSSNACGTRSSKMPDAMATDAPNLSTVEEHSQTDAKLNTKAPEVPSLVVLWAANEPTRAGEVLVVPPGSPGPWRLFGRGPASGDDPEQRILLSRHRPGSVLASPPITSPSISRAQFLSRCTEANTLWLKNLGKCRLTLNGNDLAEGEVVPGDILELGKQMVFLCVQRPAWLEGSAPGADHPFGEADRHEIVGESAAMWKLRERIAFIGQRQGHVLIQGPTGTGKELVAGALHACSAQRHLVSHNAATTPEGLVDAEFFGNAKNYPNAGMPERPGFIGAADGGTLFLDEFAEMPMNLQAHLLRVLDGGEYTRLGEAKSRHAKFRLIAATNRPETALKHDVLARFPFRIVTLGLNDRREDIPLLAASIVQRIMRDEPAMAQRFGVNAGEGPPFSMAFVRAMVLRVYTEHVRELKALLWRSIEASKGPCLDVPAEETEIAQRANVADDSAPLPNTSGRARAEKKRDDEPRLTPAVIQAALDKSNGSIEATWRDLGLPSRYALHRLIRRYGLVIKKGPR